jgi:NAD(P)-dependent dehydrogenase (short-subunit alcohol dehydrogenase family)
MLYSEAFGLTNQRRVNYDFSRQGGSDYWWWDGIGRCAAESLVALGAKVVINGRREDIVILKGTFFASQAAIPAMRQRGGGAIVNVGSMWATQAIGLAPSSAYSAAKAGVHALTRNLAIEFAKDRIRVNTVAPAVVETPVYSTFLTPEQVAEVLPSFNAFHPLGRNGQPQDVVAAILFLASDEAAWITGALLPVDGGVTAGR